MILHLEYLKRTPHNGNVVPGQVNFNDKARYEIHFNTEGCDEAALRKGIEGDMLTTFLNFQSNYQSGWEWNLSEFIIPESNCFSWHFDNEKYNDDQYVQNGGRGWKYKNYPPLGKANDGDLKVDPRRMIDSLLAGLYKRIVKVVFYDGASSFELLGCTNCDEQNQLYTFDEVQIHSVATDGKVKDIKVTNAKVRFPYKTINTPNVVKLPFPPIMAGEYELEENPKVTYKWDLWDRYVSIKEGDIGLFEGTVEIITAGAGDDGNDEVWKHTGLFTWNAREPIYTPKIEDIEDDKLKDSFAKLISGIQPLDFRVGFVVSDELPDMDNRNRGFLCGIPYVNTIEKATFEAGKFNRILVGMLRYSGNRFEWTIKYSKDQGADVKITYLAGAFYDKAIIDVLDQNNVLVSYVCGRQYPNDLSSEFTIYVNEQYKYDESIPVTLRNVATLEKLNELLINMPKKPTGKAEAHTGKSEAVAQKENASAGNEGTTVEFRKSKVSLEYDTTTLGQLMFDGFEKDDRIIEKVSVSATDWLPIINNAARGKTGIIDYIEKNYGSSKELPPIPNFAIMGDAGTGKTTLALNLAKNCFGAVYKAVMPNELTEVYIGHAKGLIGSIIYKMGNMANNGQPCILFIDEAYMLFEESKAGSKGTAATMEIIKNLADPTLRTPIDISSFSEKDKAGFGFPVNEEFTSVNIPKNFSLWLGGYTERLSVAFQANVGLDRLFTRLILPTPFPSRLIDRFHDLMIDSAQNDPEIASEEVESLLAKGKPSYYRVSDFVRWVTSPTFSQIFGNYAGIEKLKTDCINHIRLTGDDTDMWPEAIERALKAKREDVKERYKYSLVSELGKLPFEAVTDIRETFDDYDGNDSIKAEMSDIIDMMVNEEMHRERGISLPKGALMMGPPGTGKTYLARCMAGELQKRLSDAESEKTTAFFIVSGPELKGTINPAKTISALFSSADEYDYVIIFIDEIDAIGKKRELQQNFGPLIQLMKEMDGFVDRNNVFVLAATNAPDDLDAALKREGRFDIQLEIGEPDKKTSELLFRRYLNKYGIDYHKLKDTQKSRLSRLLAGYTPAQVKADLNETVLLYYRIQEWLKKRKADEERLEYAHRKNADDNGYAGEGVNEDDIDIDLLLLDLKEVIDVKKIGRRRDKSKKDEILSEEDFPGKKNSGLASTAIHETGHALMNLIFDRKIERITVLSRANYLGYVQPGIDSDDSKSREYFTQSIMISMGGRVAEEIIYGPDNISTGASSDIQMATDTAKRMALLWGFSKNLGFMAMSAYTGGYLGGSMVPIVSDGYMLKAEEEINAILKDCYEKTQKILSENKEILKDLAYEVYTKLEMTGEELKDVYDKLKK